MDLEIRLEASRPDKDKTTNPEIRYKLYDAGVCVGEYETQEEVARAKYRLMQQHEREDGSAGNR